MNLSFLFLTGFISLFEGCQGTRMLKLIPGVPTLSFHDTRYLQDIVFNTRRYSRKSDYVVNLEFTTTVTFGNNLSLSLIFNEYLHNEYRRSFVEFHYTLCNLILNDTIVGAVVRKAGFTVCPLPPGRYHLLNLTFDQEFPSVFPFEKGSAELFVKLGPSAKLIAKGNLVLTFKQRIV